MTIEKREDCYTSLEDFLAARDPKNGKSQLEVFIENGVSFETVMHCYAHASTPKKPYTPSGVRRFSWT